MEDTNQHYITRAYLDKFIHPSSDQKVLYPYERRRGACDAKGVKRLGSHKNFFRQNDNGEITDKLDEARELTERLLFSSGRVNPSSLAQCVFNDDFLPTAKDRLHFAAAAAFLFCSSPVQIHNTAMDHLLFAQMDLFNKMNSAEMRSMYDKKYGEQAATRLEEDREKVLHGKLVMDVGEENWRQLGFDVFQFEKQFIHLIQEMQMTIVDCHPKSVFLTSDNPVVRTFPTRHDSLDDQVWFPISYKRGILWHRNNLPGRTTFGHSQTRAFNRRVIKYSYKKVFAPLPEDWIEAAVTTEDFDPLLGHYGSLDEVMKHALQAESPEKGHSKEIVDLFAAMKAGKRLDVVKI